MTDIVHRIGIKKPAAEVYSALSTIKGLAGWWTQDTTGTSKVGGEIQFRFYDSKGKIMGEMHTEVLKLDPNKLVQWRVKAGPPEWIGTDITFNLNQEGDTTIVMFGHRNWPKAA